MNSVLESSIAAFGYITTGYYDAYVSMFSFDPQYMNVFIFLNKMFCTGILHYDVLVLSVAADVFSKNFMPTISVFDLWYLVLLQQTGSDTWFMINRVISNDFQYPSKSRACCKSFLINTIFRTVVQPLTRF